MLIKKEYVENLSISTENNHIRFKLDLSPMMESVNKLYEAMWKNDKFKCDIETDLGTLYNCIFSSFDFSLGDGNAFTEISVEGYAEYIDKMIEVIFEDCKNKIWVRESIYNRLIENLGQKITHEQYSLSEFAESL